MQPEKAVATLCTALVIPLFASEDLDIFWLRGLEAHQKGGLSYCVQAMTLT